MAAGEPQWWHAQFKDTKPPEQKIKDLEQELENAYRDLSTLRVQMLERDMAEWDEQKLRNKNKGLMDLWDKYQTMLQLVKEHEQDND